jgi:hypothetical protein
MCGCCARRARRPRRAISTRRSKAAVPRPSPAGSWNFPRRRMPSNRPRRTTSEAVSAWRPPRSRRISTPQRLWRTNAFSSLDTAKRNGVADGTRTHDSRDHNPGLYQLSYGHHRKTNRNGAPGRSRTCDHRLRRPVLYPTELRAHSRNGDYLTRAWTSSVGRGSRIRTCDPLLPKQMRYQTAPCPVCR